ncbi:MAG: uroporphyrinogen-III synthase [Gemmatimonadota bacterium]|nr:uroporphyrinogen-III synthase [Gemmatimonadota bacterium]
MSALAGRAVVVTRSREQAAAFRAALEARGARVIVFPTIDTRSADDPEPVRRAVAALEAYAWVVFTSVNAVRFFAAPLALRPGGRLPPGVHVAAVGTATAAALAERGIRVDAMPEEFVGVRIPEALGDVRGKRLLLPRSDIGRVETVEALREAGALVDDVTVYHTVPATLDPDGLEALRAGVDAITFTSPSTVTNLVTLLGADTARLLDRVVVASIGPVTSQAIRAAGFPVHVEPLEHTMDGLLDSLETYFAGHATGVAGELR